MNRKLLILTAAIITVVLTVGQAHAACVNKYVARTDGNKKVLTLLTGRMTYAEAQDLSKKLLDKDSPPVAWVDEGGKTIATSVQFQAVRPMPVACDDKPSGSVINVTFLTFSTPKGGITVKFDNDLLVYFEEQSK